SSLRLQALRVTLFLSVFFFSSRRRHTRWPRDWSSDVCSSDLVAHERGVSLSEPGREQVYFTDAYIGFGVTDHWALRFGADPSKYADDVRATLKAFDPHLLITDMRPMDAVVEKAQSGTRFSL